MRAVYKYADGPGSIDVRDVPEPTPGPGEVVIEVKAAGVCGSDIHLWHWDIKLNVRTPVILGHEFCGVVAAVGSGVTGRAPGERVTSETSFKTCGVCTNCRTGNFNICENKQLIGYVWDGCFAKYVKVPEIRVHHLPENVSFEEGAMTEPLASCVNGTLSKTPIAPGDVVVVAGPGGIGLLTMQLAKQAGGRIILCGTTVDEQRLALGKSLGADYVVNVQTENPRKLVDELTNGEGAEVFLDCSGAPPSVLMGLGLLRRGGKYTQIGLIGKAFPLEWDTVAYKEIQVTGSLGSNWSHWKQALTLMSTGKISLKPLISNIFPISEWEKAFQSHQDKSGIKILLTPEN